MVKKIALEEHFLTPDFVEYWNGTIVDAPSAVAKELLLQLLDFDSLRLEAMDRGGIEKAVLSVSGPGVQIEKDRSVAVRRAIQVNDALAAQIQRRPKRFDGFAHLPMQDPAAAAQELERCISELGFKGAMINGQTHGCYLDDRIYDRFWETAQALRAPIYIHPADPPAQPVSFAAYRELSRATWGWTVETASHALRIIFGGVFDRVPAAQVILGHMGETLPFQLWRLDSRAKLYGVKLRREPSEYIRSNFLLTISGVYSQEPLDCAIAALGVEKIMFGADYPFESLETAATFIDCAAISEAARFAICFENAERVFKIA